MKLDEAAIIFIIQELEDEKALMAMLLVIKERFSHYNLHRDTSLGFDISDETFVADTYSEDFVWVGM